MLPGSQITIHVHDAQTGKPIPDALVQFASDVIFPDGTENAGFTDSRGELRFQIGSQHGWRTLKVPVTGTKPVEAAPGYALERQLDLEPGESVDWDVKINSR